MKFKTLLLGSAAAFVVAGGAQAADLSIAEPVDYVRVCDAFGTGYWYIPGTDTCLKIGGSVQFDIKFQHVWDEDYEDYVGWIYEDHSANWKFVTEAVVDFTAKSMTEYGPLTGYVKLKGVYDPTNADKVFLDEAYLSLGHVLFGHTGSAQNIDGGYAPGAWHPDESTNQIKLSWAAAGFGLQLGIEDPRERWGSELVDIEPLGDWESYSAPDITGNITFSGGHMSAKITGGVGWIEDWWTPTWDNAMVYGIAGTVEGDFSPFKVRVGGAFGTGSAFTGRAPIHTDGFNNWTAFVSAIWQATPTFSVAGTYAYAASDFWPGEHMTSGGAKLVWAPVAGFEAYAEGKAWKWNLDSEHEWEGKVGVKRSW